MRLFNKAQYRFIEARQKAYVVSGIVLAIGVGAMVTNIASLGSWQNYGVDFVGGSLVQVRFEQPVTAGELRDALGGAQAPPITQFGSGNEFVIRAPLNEDASITEVAENLEASVLANLPNSGVEVVRTELVGAKVGAELQTKALQAVLFSFILTLLYLAFRFELRFGLAAVIATEIGRAHV